MSHAFIGSAVAALAPDGAHPALVWGALIGAEVPDIDFVIRYWGGPVTYLKHHRGPTHGLIVLPLHSAIIAVGLRLLWPDAAFGQVFLWTLLGCLSHVLFDFGNDYGTQGLWPFSGRRVALDIIPIVDLWLLGTIAAGWIAHWLLPGHRQFIFTVVWLAMGTYVLLRLWLHARAVHLAAVRFDLSVPCENAAPCGPGWPPQRLTVHPMLLSLNAWRYLVQSTGEYQVGMVWVVDGRVSEPMRARNEQDRIVLASMQSQIVTEFSHWVRRPRVTVEREEGLYKVVWSDMRYEVDEFAPFTAYAHLDENLSLVNDGLGSQKPQSMDRGAIRRRLRLEMGRME